MLFSIILKYIDNPAFYILLDNEMNIEKYILSRNVYSYDIMNSVYNDIKHKRNTISYLEKISDNEYFFISTDYIKNENIKLLNNFNRKIIKPFNEMFFKLNHLKKNIKDEKDSKTISEAIDNYSDILRMTNNIIDYFQLNNYNILLEEEIFCFNSVVENTILFYKSVMKENNTKIVFLNNMCSNVYLDFIKTREIIYVIFHNIILRNKNKTIELRTIYNDNNINLHIYEESNDSDDINIYTSYENGDLSCLFIYKLISYIGGNIRFKRENTQLETIVSFNTKIYRDVDIKSMDTNNIKCFIFINNKTIQDELFNILNNNNIKVFIINNIESMFKNQGNLLITDRYNFNENITNNLKLKTLIFSDNHIINKTNNIDILYYPINQESIIRKIIKILNLDKKVIILDDSNNAFIYKKQLKNNYTNILIKNNLYSIYNENISENDLIISSEKFSKDLNIKHYVVPNDFIIDINTIIN